MTLILDLLFDLFSVKWNFPFCWVFASMQLLIHTSRFPCISFPCISFPCISFPMYLSSMHLSSMHLVSHVSHFPCISFPIHNFSCISFPIHSFSYPYSSPPFFLFPYNFLFPYIVRKIGRKAICHWILKIFRQQWNAALCCFLTVWTEKEGNPALLNDKSVEIHCFFLYEH